ncbi:MAG TPA: YfhO family protein [Planctomycetota bacterium]|nr:YfhO family protein [Planctomycetota bacterium]
MTFTRRESDRVELRVWLKSPAFLVLADTDYPGWEAVVGGKPATIYRANIAFRAVAVPAGDHAVVFRFRPEPARHGAIGSSIFLLMGIGFVATGRFRKAASAPSGPPR